jgi:hypothetical protein
MKSERAFSAGQTLAREKMQQTVSLLPDSLLGSPHATETARSRGANQGHVISQP